MDAAVADIAMGNKPDLKPKIEQYTGIFYFHLGNGKKIKAINNWRKISDNEEVIHASLQVINGDVIPPLTDSAKRSGFIILKEKTKTELLLKAKLDIDKLQQSIIFD